MASQLLDTTESKILVLGASGLVGSQFLQEISESFNISKIYTISRKRLKNIEGLDKIEHTVEPDSSKWVNIIGALDSIDIVFSCIGTTRSTAGGYISQYHVDHDLNLLLANAAKNNGAKVFMLITSFNNKLLYSMFSYFALKKQVEDDSIALNFDITIILRPGPLVGDRSKLKNKASDSEPFASVLSSVIARLIYNTPCSPYFGNAIGADEVAQAAVHLIETSTYAKKVKIVSSRDMMLLANSLKGI